MIPAARARALDLLNQFKVELQVFQQGLELQSSEVVQSAYRIISRYEVLSGTLYRLRAQLRPDDPFRSRFEESFAEISQDILSLQRAREERASPSRYDAWKRRYRSIWRENFPLFLFTVIVFLAGVFMGWQLVREKPDFVLAIIPQRVVEDVLEKRAWFQEIQRSPLLDGLGIAYNNIRVSFFCFILGALCGIGGLYILLMNALMLGALAAFCTIHQFDQELTDFVVGHGLLELTIIVASAFASFLLGRVFYMRPYKHFSARIRASASDAVVIFTGVAPWLVLAACVEVFVSPWPEYSFEAKLGISTGISVLFWIWTFWPVDSGAG